MTLTWAELWAGASGRVNKQQDPLCRLFPWREPQNSNEQGQGTRHQGQREKPFLVLTMPKHTRRESQCHQTASQGSSAGATSHLTSEPPNGAAARASGPDGAGDLRPGALSPQPRSRPSAVTHGHRGHTSQCPTSSQTGDQHTRNQQTPPEPWDSFRRKRFSGGCRASNSAGALLSDQGRARFPASDARPTAPPYPPTPPRTPTPLPHSRPAHAIASSTDVSPRRQDSTSPSAKANATRPTGRRCSASRCRAARSQ